MPSGKVFSDAAFNAMRQMNDAAEDRIEMPRFVRALLAKFADEDGEYDGHEGLASEVFELYEHVEGESNKVALMREILRSVNLCSEGEEDDLPDDPEVLVKAAEAALGKGE